jgi:chromosome segregation ATPase
VSEENKPAIDLSGVSAWDPSDEDIKKAMDDLRASINSAKEKDEEIESLKNEIKELEGIVKDLEYEVEDLRDENDELEREVDDLEKQIAAQGNPIEITRRHIITLRDAIEKFGGTNSERADLAEVLRCVEAME